MARPLRIQFPGAYYHITCRGIERRMIYLDNRDRYRFLAMLADSLETYQVVLYAYIMMNNHFHLLIQTRKGNCAEFMRHFNIRYTGWFNWRHHRNGNLYQGRYEAYLIDGDNYLLEVSRYLHLNCVRVMKLRGLGYREQWQYIKEYQWSSVHGYLDEKKAVKDIEYGLILSMVGDRRGYRKFVLDGIKKDMGNPFKKVKSRIILGDDEFVAKAKKYIKRASVREQPSYRDIVIKTLEPEEVIGMLIRECGIRKGTLQRRGVNGEVRGMVAELLYKYSEITQAQIGRLIGDIDYVSVHHLRKRFKGKMRKSSEVREIYKKAEIKLRNRIQNAKI
ncbi:transposase [candidate division WOR-3 bacterium]|nr:transposase [candidate division WOR-3 bacterium]